MRRKIIQYNPALKEKARWLRNNCTVTEKMLWRHLKGRQMMGYDFHRQKPLNSFIVDFFCNELMLAIEIDGPSHYGRETEDMERQEKLESFGVRFLRFSDDEVYYGIDNVCLEIERWIKENGGEASNDPHTPHTPDAE